VVIFYQSWHSAAICQACSPGEQPAENGAMQLILYA
jgi:hypothetical protein